MSVAEKNKLRKMFKKVKVWEIIDHVNDRIEQKQYKINTDDLLNVIKNGEIIEYEQKKYIKGIFEGKISHMVVLQIVRDREGLNYQYKDKLNVVFDMTDGKIVTLWENNYHDNHDTLNLGIYSKGLKVGEVYWQD